MKKSTHHVLVVEDKESLRLALTEKLRHEGYDVSSAKDGEEGLAMAIAEKPDIILLDIIIPKVDGMQMLKAVRASNEWGANVPVIVLTNSKEKGDIAEALVEGVAQYLAKADWKIEDIVKKVSTLLAP